MSNASAPLRGEKRRRRLPSFVLDLIKDKAASTAFLAVEPLARMLFQLGMLPDPDLGIENFDAIYALLKDAIGIAPLTDTEFERALRLSVPPEYREAAQ